MDKKFNFLMAIHFHQPVDNFGFVFEEISDKCYEPFLYAIQDFPSIKFNLHYSGGLLEWFRDNRPNVMEIIKSLAENQQVEIIGGGFYEPILSAVCPGDALGQIDMMKGFIKSNFNVDSEGAWLAERIWEPHLPELLARSKIKYTIIDDQHLIYAGCDQNQLYGHYITEHNSNTIGIIPSDKFLRYAIPFKPPQDTIDYFNQIIKVHGKNTVCYGDDGEKFGAWPDTYKDVYEKGWLKKFLQILEKNASWVKTWRISDYLKENPSNGLIYIPNVSYEEMNEWSLPFEAGEALVDLKQYLKTNNLLRKYNIFLRTGIWKNFLIKYPEINHIHKKVMMVSKRLSEIQERLAAMEDSDNKKTSGEQLTRAKRELYKAECNCVYWHGVFGGLYFYHLRAALYKHIIEAENIIDELDKKPAPRIEINELDFDCDGEQEFIVNTAKNTIIIDKAEGAAVTEWSLKTKPLNIANTLSRRKELYHKNIKEKLYYDNYRRSLFLDHFFKENITLKALQKSQYIECGDFLNVPYYREATESVDSVQLYREGMVDGQEIMLRKVFSFGKEKETIRVSYSIQNLSSRQAKLFFGPELNFSITNDDRENDLLSVESVKFHDSIEGIRVDIDFSKPTYKFFRYPVYTVSQSQNNIETNYQASCIVGIFKLVIDKGASAEIDISASVKSAS
jgi:4-alpha-glucanotransferase